MLPIVCVDSQLYLFSAEPRAGTHLKMWSIEAPGTNSKAANSQPSDDHDVVMEGVDREECKTTARCVGTFGASKEAYFSAVDMGFAREYVCS